MAEGVVTLSNETTEFTGSWEITENAQGRLVMAISFGDEPGVSFEWPLSDLRNDRLKFEIPEIGYELILQRVCNDNADDGDVLEIRNKMMAGNWVVSSYIEGDNELKATLADYTINFGILHLMGITLGEMGTVQPGLWRVLRNSEGKLKIYFNAGDTEPLSVLTDDWTFVSINEGRLEVKDISGGNGTVRVLVFERIQP
jgi:hypothetical protein